MRRVPRQGDSARRYQAAHSPGRSVVVLGMHRSGTSVLTRVINLLGLQLCREDDIYTAPDNPTGHWESVSLVAFNNRLIDVLGGKPAAPAMPATAGSVTRNSRPASGSPGGLHACSSRNAMGLEGSADVPVTAILAVGVGAGPGCGLRSPGAAGGCAVHAPARRIRQGTLRRAVGALRPYRLARSRRLTAGDGPVRRANDRSGGCGAELSAHLAALGVPTPGDAAEAARFVSAEQVANRQPSLRLAEDPDATEQPASPADGH